MAKILIVDDDPDMVEAGRYVLEKQGHSVTSASNVEAGLKALDEELARPADPRRHDGRSRRRSGLRPQSTAQGPHALPILMLTSVNRAMGLSIGKDDEMVPVDEFVEKPVDPAVLIAKVDGLLAAKGA